MAMFVVNCAATGVCILYGVYVYRVLRHAPYHDLRWLRWRTKTSPTSPDTTSQRESQPSSSPMSRIAMISDADLFEGTRRLYRGEAAAKLVASGEPDESSHRPAGWPPEGSQN
jgi:hypothetical protein